MSAIRHTTEYIKENTRIISDGFVQIAFRNLGSLPLVVADTVLNSGEFYNPTFLGGTFPDETFYEIKFAEGSGTRLCWVQKTYVTDDTK